MWSWICWKDHFSILIYVRHDKDEWMMPFNFWGRKKGFFLDCFFTNFWLLACYLERTPSRNCFAFLLDIFFCCPKSKPDCSMSHAIFRLFPRKVALFHHWCRHCYINTLKSVPMTFYVNGLEANRFSQNKLFVKWKKIDKVKVSGTTLFRCCHFRAALFVRARRQTEGKRKNKQFLSANICEIEFAKRVLIW